MVKYGKIINQSEIFQRFPAMFHDTLRVKTGLRPLAAARAVDRCGPVPLAVR